MEKDFHSIKPYKCTRCGSTDFEDAGVKRVVCSDCGSQLRVLTNESSVVINKGAKVVFGENVNMEIRGDMDVLSGAYVDIQGKVTVLKGGKQQVFSLKLLKEGDDQKSNK